MYKYLNLFILVAIVSLSLGIYFLYSKNKSLVEEVDVLSNNQKAYLQENSSLQESNRVFKYTIEQLDYYNDSILEVLNNTRKELKIKDKNLLALQYLKSEASKTDTVVYNDTIFRDNITSRDTIIGDNWYSMRIVLEHPNTILTTPTFISEKHIVTSKKKETVNPSKKFFLFRWFQKKHWVIEVNVEEKNPYIKNKQNKFIEIIE